MGKMPEIGTKKTYQPEAVRECVPKDMRTVTGTVVWVHPKGRFYLVEVTVNGHTWQECFNIF